MDQEKEVYVALDEIFNDIFDRDDIVLTPELTAKDVEGWDSFRQIDIIIAVQQHFNIKFRTREMETLNNVGDLVRAVLAKQGGG